jgi:hypothetical protein
VGRRFESCLAHHKYQGVKSNRLNPFFVNANLALTSKMYFVAIFVAFLPLGELRRKPYKAVPRYGSHLLLAVHAVDVSAKLGFVEPTEFGNVVG